MLLTYISHTHSICHTTIIRNYFNNNKSLKNNILIIVRCLHKIIQNFLVVILYFNYFVWIIYSCSPSIALNLLTFFSLGILNVPCDSLVSISRLWISMSLFFTWYSSSNFSPKTMQDLS